MSGEEQQTFSLFYSRQDKEHKQGKWTLNISNTSGNLYCCKRPVSHWEEGFICSKCDRLFQVHECPDATGTMKKHMCHLLLFIATSEYPNPVEEFGMLVPTEDEKLQIFSKFPQVALFVAELATETNFEKLWFAKEHQCGVGLIIDYVDASGLPDYGHYVWSCTNCNAIIFSQPD